MKMVQVFGIAPCLGSEILPTQPPIPLTFFDILWLRLPSLRRIFFFEFPHPTTLFFDSVVPKLKHSLSLALGHFYPLAGHLTLSLDDSNKPPFIKYNENDTVYLAIAESDADFNHLAGSDLYEATQINHLLPNLAISDEKASILALQITLFPNSGFSIGIAFHHAVLDGKTLSSFIKSWVNLCIESSSPPSCSNLPPELHPFYDREILLKDPYQLEEIYVTEWLKKKRSFLEFWDIKLAEHAIRGLFQLPRSHIEKLKELTLSKLKQKGKNFHLSTFVISVAHMWVCRVKAEQVKNKTTILRLNMDCRARLEAPLPPTYFGNCVGVRLAVAETGELLGEEGVVVAVEAISEALEGLEEGRVMKGAERWGLMMLSGGGYGDDDVKVFGVGGSPKFEAYGNDFGWGRPKKVEVPFDTSRVISISDTRNGDGAIEIGFVSTKHILHAFASLFAKTLP